MSSQPTELIEFPCVFPLKIMGAQHPDFEQEVLKTIQKNAPTTQASDITIRPSSKGNYLGATAQVRVESKEQLDNIYRSLTSHPMVKVVL